MDKFDLLQYALSEYTKDFFELDLYDRLHHPFQSMEKAFISELSDVFEKQKIIVILHLWMNLLNTSLKYLVKISK